MQFANYKRTLLWLLLPAQYFVIHWLEIQGCQIVPATNANPQHGKINDDVNIAV